MLTENHLLYKYFIYGLKAYTKTSGNVRATVETQQLTVDRAALHGVCSNSHPCISEVPPDFDIISVYGGAVFFLNHITRELANFSQSVDKLWDIHNKLICYIFYMSEDADW